MANERVLAADKEEQWGETGQTRYYQEDIIVDLQDTDDDVIIQMPTGAGKTRTICEYLAREGRPCIIVAHRNELLAQFQKELEFNHELEYELWTVNKLTKCAEDQKTLHRIRGGTLVIDEAHRAASSSYVAITDVVTVPHYNIRIIGLSATPVRGDGKPLGFIFDRLVVGPTHAELLKQNYLVPCSRIFSTSHPLNLSAIPITGGDYQQGKAGAYLSRSKHKAKVVDTWKLRASLRRTLAFCCSIEHCYALSKEFESKGVSNAVVIGRTPLEQRGIYVDLLVKRDIKVLITCLVFTEGIDIPEIECIIVDRPTRLLNLWIQMVGRGARIAEGKKDFWLIDHCGLAHNFGIPLSDNVEWSLHDKPVVREQRPEMCKNCGAVLPPDRVEIVRRGGGVMLCLVCMKSVNLRRRLSWEDREGGDLVLYGRSEPINPCGYEWRTDITDDKFRLFRALMLPVETNQHRVTRRENIVRRVHIFKKRYFRLPKTAWFLPTCSGLTSAEVYAACLHVVSNLVRDMPEDNPKKVTDMARAVFEQELSFNSKPKELDYKAIENSFFESLAITDLYEV